MAIPTYQELMLPVLQVLNEKGPMRINDLAMVVADRSGLSDAEKTEVLPSGRQLYIVNRTGWAGWYLMQAGLVSRPRRAHFAVTDEGKRLLATNPSSIDNELLAKYPSFVEKVLKPRSGQNERDSVTSDETANPEEIAPADEQIETAFSELRRTLVNDVLEQILKVDPFRFERIVVDLLVRMGYGGSQKEAAQVTQKTGDEGIDGVINEDRLGLDVIYVQAKRWKNSVGRPEIQNFVGALAGKKANKGVFITTSSFHSNAREYAAGLHQKVILIDGQRLAELMIDYNVGVAIERTYEVKRIDSDYFLDDAI